MRLKEIVRWSALVLFLALPGGVGATLPPATLIQDTTVTCSTGPDGAIDAWVRKLDEAEFDYVLVQGAALDALDKYFQSKGAPPKPEPIKFIIAPQSPKSGVAVVAAFDADGCYLGNFSVEPAALVEGLRIATGGSP